MIRRLAGMLIPTIRVSIAPSPGANSTVSLSITTPATKPSLSIIEYYKLKEIAMKNQKNGQWNWENEWKQLDTYSTDSIKTCVALDPESNVSSYLYNYALFKNGGRPAWFTDPYIDFDKPTRELNVLNTSKDTIIGEFSDFVSTQYPKNGEGLTKLSAKEMMPGFLKLQALGQLEDDKRQIKRQVDYVNKLRNSKKID